MTAHQRHIAEVFDGFKSSRALAAETVQLVDRLQERLSTCTDLEREARALYGVQRAQELSVGLLWTLSQLNTVGNGSTLSEDVVRRLYAGLDRLFGIETAPVSAMPAEMPFEESSASPLQPAPDSAIESIEEPEPVPMPEEASPPMEQASPVLPPSGAATTESLGGVLEKFIEAIQGGSDDRAQLLDEVQAQCAGLGETRSDDAALSSYLSAVSDFLGYIKSNDLLDDIRVMNVVTNFQEPYAQWLSAPEGGREGILEQGVEFLTDFRAMFE